MIFERLGKVLRGLALRTSILPKSQLGKALTYPIGNWERLGGFLTDGRLEIDNNLVETAMRPTKIGAKNWLFIGRKEAGQSAAVLYPSVENCRRLGRDLREYLGRVLTRLPAIEADEAAALTPARRIRRCFGPGSHSFAGCFGKASLPGSVRAFLRTGPEPHSRGRTGQFPPPAVVQHGRDRADSRICGTFLTKAASTCSIGGLSPTISKSPSAKS